MFIIAQINSNSEKDVQEILKRLGGWPVLLGDKWDERNWDWKETLFKFQSIGYSSDHLITLDIDVDLKDNTKRALTVGIFFRLRSDQKTINI